MTVQREYGEIIFECDECGALLDTHTKDWQESKSVLERDNWSYARDDDTNEWLHFCETCSEK